MKGTSLTWVTNRDHKRVRERVEGRGRRREREGGREEREKGRYEKDLKRTNWVVMDATGDSGRKWEVEKR